MDTRPRRRGGLLASLLPGLLVVAVLGTTGGTTSSGSVEPVVDLTVVHGDR